MVKVILHATRLRRRSGPTIARSLRGKGARIAPNSPAIRSLRQPGPMRPATGENVATHPKTCAASYPIISILFTIAIADVIRFIFKSGNATRTTNSIKKSDVLKKIPPVQ
ncbi:hypothetical protein [Burkholderia ubonensis]|uniref:hypothetical protein n=1 Tax=Burkholderia ubonensis TaxID=101571 RepID=UPI0012FB6FA9|nr:hypothetical protein [Burkholderia ubonensis]